MPCLRTTMVHRDDSQNLIHKQTVFPIKMIGFTWKSFSYSITFTKTKKKTGKADNFSWVLGNMLSQSLKNIFALFTQNIYLKQIYISYENIYIYIYIYFHKKYIYI